MIRSPEQRQDYTWLVHQLRQRVVGVDVSVVVQLNGVIMCKPAGV